MKTVRISLFLTLLFAVAAPIFAQTQTQNGDIYGRRRDRTGNRFRLQESARLLSEQADDLSATLYEDYSSRNRNRNRNRTVNANYSVTNEFEQVFLAEQFKAGAALFGKMVRDRANTQDLRQAFEALEDLAQRGDSSIQQGRWSEVQNTLREIQTLLANSNNGNGYPGDSRYGSFTWRGTVDGRVQLTIQNSTVQTRTVTGRAVSNTTHNFTASLPYRTTNLSLVKKQGRGAVTIVQQPSQTNNWTTIVEINDATSGTAVYELELSW